MSPAPTISLAAEGRQLWSDAGQLLGRLHKSVLASAASGLCKMRRREEKSNGRGLVGSGVKIRVDEVWVDFHDFPGGNFRDDRAKLGEAEAGAKFD